MIQTSGLCFISLLIGRGVLVTFTCHVIEDWQWDCDILLGSNAYGVGRDGYNILLPGGIRYGGIPLNGFTHEFVESVPAWLDVPRSRADMTTVWSGVESVVSANRKLVEDYLLLEGPIMEAQMVRSDGRPYGEVGEAEDDQVLVVGMAEVQSLMTGPTGVKQGYERDPNPGCVNQEVAPYDGFPSVEATPVTTDASSGLLVNASRLEETKVSPVLVERPKKTGQAKRKQKCKNKFNKKENSSLPAQVALQNLLLPPGVVPMAGGSISRLGHPAQGRGM